MKNNLKKIFIGFTLIFICAGCGNSSFEEKTPDIDLFDSKIDYILFRDKKIYLSQSLEDYVMQFKGLGCKFRAPDSKIQSDMSIDNINDNSHAFYSLSANTVLNGYSHDGEIRCNDSTFDVILENEKTEADSILYTDMNIYHWTMYPYLSDEIIEVIIDGQKLVMESDNDSTREDVIKIMGNNYEVEEGNFINRYDHYKYVIDGLEYKFHFNDDNELYKMTVSIE